MIRRIFRFDNHDQINSIPGIHENIRAVASDVRADTTAGTLVDIRVGYTFPAWVHSIREISQVAYSDIVLMPPGGLRDFICRNGGINMGRDLL